MHYSDTPIEIKQQAAQLREEGFTYKRIGQICNVDPSTVRCWLDPAARQQKRVRLRRRDRKRRQEGRRNRTLRARCATAIRSSRAAEKKYGYSACISPVELLMLTFNSRCHICGVSETERRLAMDHCHTTGRFRGWLCLNCNRLLGSVGDDATVLRTAANYIESSH